MCYSYLFTGLTRQYAPRLRIGLHCYLDSITSAESEEEGDEDDNFNTSRYLKIRFDPSVALCDGMIKSGSNF